MAGTSKALGPVPRRAGGVCLPKNDIANRCAGVSGFEVSAEFVHDIEAKFLDLDQTKRERKSDFELNDFFEPFDVSNYS